MAGLAARLLQHDDGSFTSPPQARPGQVGLVCSRDCVRSATAIGGGGGSSRVAATLLYLAPGLSSSFPLVSVSMAMVRWR